LEENLSYRTILVNDNPPIRTITLNRPERRNAMTQEMQTELISAFEDAAAGDIRVLIVTGAGEAFCSGLDLSELQALQNKTAADHRTDAERIARLFVTLNELPIPTIAAVHGPAIAGGTGLAMVCDFTFATPASISYRHWFRLSCRCRWETSDAVICCSRVDCSKLQKRMKWAW
jgi:methylglutaconyl-CoA hydratase